MNLESPSISSRLIDIDDDDLDEDLLEPFGLSPEDCSQMAQLFHRGSISAEKFDESRFFQLDEEFKSAVEPFMLLPDRLSLNREGLDQAEIEKLEQEEKSKSK